VITGGVSVGKNPLSSGRAVTALEEAKRALELANRELEEFRRERDSLRLRDACEKGWLAVLLVTDALLVELGKPESYSERRTLLRELEKKMPKAMGLRDRLGATTSTSLAIMRAR
jgi:hypothetical protein